ncbi:hypothetical protein I546_5877 [Mycobacterium kansasii 732]|nr:hypothetical protein I546_5877 [Mycobacterium kansasii 732]
MRWVRGRPGWQRDQVTPPEAPASSGQGLQSSLVNRVLTEC